MKIKMAGISHRIASVEIREKFAINATRLQEILQSWEENFHCELVLLSTCNRTEIYLADNESLPNDEDIFAFLYPDLNKPIENLSKNYSRKTDSSNYQCVDFRTCFQVLEDDEAVQHLFTVGASLDSMVVGEPQILFQIKTAYQAAADAQTAGPILHSLFQSTLKTAKKIAVETELFRHHVSIPSIAVVDFALNLFERLDDKSTLVFGAGEMARETLRYLVDNGAGSITIVNRNREKADELASEWNGQSADWDQRFELLKSTDLLIAATGAQEPVLYAETYRPIAAKRQNKPLFILDLSLPRNIDPNVGKIANVYLYSIDDLEKACRQNTLKRDREIPVAQRLIRLETEHFIADRRRRDSDEVIRQLRNNWNEIKENEIGRLFRKCPNLDEKSIAEIRYSFDRLVNKLLHPPMESLKDESESETSRMPEIIKRLFRL